jgi:exodeoxyribonuclease VII small subunit
MSEEMSFEEALTKLEAAVAQLEQGDALTLAESLEVFEEGIRLTRLCREKLDTAELRVQQLVEVDEDVFEMAPLEVEDEGEI